MKLLRPLLWIAALLGSALFLLLRIRPLRDLPTPQPATSYAQALARLARLQALEGELHNPLCRTQLLTHGQPTQRVMVFVHGFTNCPHQFHQLTGHFFDQGDNVLNVRLPRHGLADVLTDDLAQLRAEELIALVNEAIDIGCGLGEQVTLFGFSLGGLLSAWAAHHRPELARVILASPALGLAGVPPIRRRLYANLLTWLPNSFRWWDPVERQNRRAPTHVYPRFSTRGIAALLRLGAIVYREAQQQAPVARQVVVITNPVDTVVDNRTVEQIVTAWRRQGAAIRRYEFPATWQLIHDLIDPSQPDQQVAKVYPLLLGWLADEARRPEPTRASG
jgi:alpha-beta hydrolase superfamily lysophospholipase